VGILPTVRASLRGLEAHATISCLGAVGILPIALASSWCIGHRAHCEAVAARAGSPRHHSFCLGAVGILPTVGLSLRGPEAHATIPFALVQWASCPLHHWGVVNHINANNTL
jgi:hypothetical protein